MTSIGCDCIILVIMNGYVHLGSEGGQYVGHERAAKLVPSAPRGCLSEGGGRGWIGLKPGG